MTDEERARLEAYAELMIVEDERGFITVVTGDGRVVTTPPAWGPGSSSNSAM